MSENESQYQELIDNNRILVDYIREHNLKDKEIKQLIEDSNKFLLKILTDKDLYDAVMVEMYHYLKNLDEGLKNEV